MHLNTIITTCVLLAAVLLVEVSCDDAPNINEETKPRLKGTGAERSKRIKRAPVPTFEIIFAIGKLINMSTFKPMFDILNPTPISMIGQTIYRPPLLNNGIRWWPQPRNSVLEQIWARLGLHPVTSSIKQIQAEPTVQAPPINIFTERPLEPTSENPAGGCVLPEKPIAVSYKIVFCGSQCDVIPGTRVPVGSILSYGCGENYVLKGNNISFCTNSNTWHMLPICTKTCRALKSDSVDIVYRYQGEIVPLQSQIMPGTSATPECKRSYYNPLANEPLDRKSNCLEGGDWDRPLISCIPECGIGISRGTTLIVNGMTVLQHGDFPWHVAIYENYTNGFYQQICGGSLISAHLIVSATHCFYDETRSSLRHVRSFAVATGKFFRSYDRQEMFVQKSLVERNYISDRYYGLSGNYAIDIALVRVQTPFNLSTLVRPICVDWENAYEREHLQAVSGWGITAQGISSEELQEINLPFASHRQCISAVPNDFKGFITFDKFCAGYLNGSSLCDGDSGGGLSFQTSEHWYLRGIVSVSPVNNDICDNHYYTAFTNVGNFKDWIRDIFTSSE